MKVFVSVFNEDDKNILINNGAILVEENNDVYIFNLLDVDINKLNIKYTKVSDINL